MAANNFFSYAAHGQPAYAAAAYPTAATAVAPQAAVTGVQVRIQNLKDLIFNTIYLPYNYSLALFVALVSGLLIQILNNLI